MQRGSFDNLIARLNPLSVFQRPRHEKMEFFCLMPINYTRRVEKSSLLLLVVKFRQEIIYICK